VAPTSKLRTGGDPVIRLANAPLTPYLPGMANPNLHPPEPIETETERQTEEDRLLDEAEAEAERVGTIPFEEVEAWVRSWGTPNELPQPEPRK
jgi:hypothetical protein